MSGPPRLGHVTLTLQHPHPGQGPSLHRWFERDHRYASLLAPWTLGGGIWVAPPGLVAARLPAGSDAVTGAPGRGTYLSAYGVALGGIEEQQDWTSRHLDGFRDRPFPHRDAVLAAAFDVVAPVERVGGSPVELFFEQRPAGLLALWLQDPGGRGDQARTTRAVVSGADHLMASCPWTVAMVLHPRPKPAWYPAQVPDPPGLDDHVVVLCGMDEPPVDAGGMVRQVALAATSLDTEVVLAAPFLAVAPGADLGDDLEPVTAPRIS